MSDKYRIQMAEAIVRIEAERDAALADVELWRSRCGAKCYEAEQLQQRLTAEDERVDVLEGLLLRTNELLYEIQGDPGAVPSSSIDAMRGEVFIALKPAEGGGDEA